jgi:radical SAM superfamily enzyme YgiQ (UPF0313 family)
MKFQIIIPQYTGYSYYHPPYGAMYIARSLMDEGHEVRIEVGDDWKSFDFEELHKRIEGFSPVAIGFSAVVSTSYKYVKAASKYIKQHFPDIKIIVGGGLTAAADLVLKNTYVDIAVLGEGEITIKHLVDKIEKKADYSDVNGIAYREGDRILYTAPRSPIAKLDTLGYPAFDLVDIDKYLINANDFVRGLPFYRDWDKRFYEPHRNTRVLRIPTGRGCTSKCSFCYRHMSGIRHFSFDYLFDYIEFLMDKFDTNQFSFGDECFSSSKRWSWKFIEAFKKRNIDIMFQIFGMRVDTVDREILHAFKEIGCWMIEYGFESGSQKILNIIEKRVTVQDNINVALWTKEAGIYTSPAFVLGMPGETTETINETIDFLKKINYEFFQCTYAFPVPGTPLYDYAILKGYIVDEDKYLEEICDFTPNNFIETKAFINFTSEDKATMATWPKEMSKAVRKYNSKGLISYYSLKLRAAYSSASKTGLLKFCYNQIRKRSRLYKITKEGNIHNKRISQQDPKSVISKREDVISPEGESLRKINVKLKDV